MRKKGLSVVAIIAISFAAAIGLGITIFMHINSKIKSSIQEISQASIKELPPRKKPGDFPEEMKDFLTDTEENLLDYCVSYPNDLWKEDRMLRHYEGVVKYVDLDLSKYKQNLLPKIRAMVGKYTNQQYSNPNVNTGPIPPTTPDLKKYQNTLIEWCLIANRFEEKDDGNSAFLLSYGAIRMALHLLTDYANSASAETMETVNNIVRCASCQLIYIANSGLKHNTNMVRAIAKDMYNISADYPMFSRTLTYDIYRFNDLVSKKAEEDNYAANKIASSQTETTKFVNELKKIYKPGIDCCDQEYFKSHKNICDWEETVKKKASEVIENIETGNVTQSVAYALLINNFPAYSKQKYFVDETRNIIDGAATVLATYEYISKFKGGFKYSPTTIAKNVGCSFPLDKLAGDCMIIHLPGSKKMLGSAQILTADENNCIYSKGFNTNKKDDDIIFLTDKAFQIKCIKQAYKANYFDLDEALSKMTPDERAAYEKAKQESDKQQLEAKKKVDELISKYAEERVILDSINDFYCGFKMGEKPKNLDESKLIKSSFGLSFTVQIKKPFLGLFSLAEIYVAENDKSIEWVSFSRTCDTTSERETAFNRIKKEIESIENIKTVSSKNTLEETSFVYFSSKDKANINISLLKGFDGGGTLTVLSSHTARE